MKRVFCFLMAMLCLTTAFPSAACAADGEGSLANFKKTAAYMDGIFPDVKAQDWFSSSVASVYELGLMKGNNDGSFNPGGNITYAETLVLAAKLHSIYTTGSGTFELGDPWYSSYVLYCLKNGIIKEELEDYNIPATRGDFAAILSRALPESTMPEIRKIEDDRIPDVKMVDANAAEIYRLYRAGILSGNNARGSFAPRTPIQRSAVSRIVSCMVYRSLRSKTPLVEMSGPDLDEQERAEDEFFSDAAALGNSLVDGLKIYSKLGKAGMTFYSGTSMTVTSAMKTKNVSLKNGGTGTIVDSLCEGDYGKIYIELGINEIYTAPEDFAKAYGDMVDKIMEGNPNADIYIMALTPVTKSKSDAGVFTMSRIKALNEALYALAEEKGCWYLDCFTPLCGTDGYLPTGDSWDGVHFNPGKYSVWEECIRTHYAA